MDERELPIHMIRVLWNLLKKKKWILDTGYKGLPQGSVLRSFLYSLLGSGEDRFMDAESFNMRMMWWYMVYASHRIMEIVRALVQTACSALKVFF
jgi:hypothetical protein